MPAGERALVDRCDDPPVGRNVEHVSSMAQPGQQDAHGPACSPYGWRRAAISRATAFRELTVSDPTIPSAT
jgi:hypothetical protein